MSCLLAGREAARPFSSAAPFLPPRLRVNDFFFTRSTRRRRRGAELLPTLSILYPEEKFSLNRAIGFALIAGGAWVVFRW